MKVEVSDRSPCQKFMTHGETVDVQFMSENLHGFPRIKVPLCAQSHETRNCTS